MTIYTIGHGRRTWEEFLALIDAYAIDLVVNVRWKPVSRWAPWANRKRLEAALGDRYLYDGARLGNPAHFGSPPIAETEYRAALDDLERALRDGRCVVIMCSESQPKGCHRTDLGHDLTDSGIKSVDIL